MEENNEGTDNRRAKKKKRVGDNQFSVFSSSLTTISFLHSLEWCSIVFHCLSSLASLFFFFFQITPLHLFFVLFYFSLRRFRTWNFWRFLLRRLLSKEHHLNQYSQQTPESHKINNGKNIQLKRGTLRIRILTIARWHVGLLLFCSLFCLGLRSRSGGGTLRAEGSEGGGTPRRPLSYRYSQEAGTWRGRCVRRREMQCSRRHRRAKEGCRRGHMRKKTALHR